MKMQTVDFTQEMKDNFVGFMVYAIRANDKVFVDIYKKAEMEPEKVAEMAKEQRPKLFKNGEKIAVTVLHKLESKPVYLG